MRRQPTPAERRLSLALRAKRFEGTNFRRQNVIGRYIADLSCRTPCMLVIEVGETHGQQITYDEARTAFLESQGYRVLRFTNSEVATNLEGVLIAVQQALLPLSPALSPEGEREKKDRP